MDLKRRPVGHLRRSFRADHHISFVMVALGEPRVAHPKSTHCRLPFSTGSFAPAVEVFAQVWEHFMELVCSLSIPIPLPDRFDVSVYFGSSAVPGYTPSRGCGTSTKIDPSPIQRKLTGRLGGVGQHCPPISGEGNVQEALDE
ncbi:hypothetical protein PoB_000497500 [Plakobranchus ocellatus]|uniref:Uncharacterized protein n=1 Tax=Plakobranchus ocellatus TaxID=259542 RepID=A0AAV3Y5T5_9GAST|nr:hypothetical protein PoB_000497500 [Plakobranchus ocellatus]